MLARIRSEFFDKNAGSTRQAHPRAPHVRAWRGLSQ